MKKLLLSLTALGLFTAVYAQKLDRSIQPQPGPAPTINWNNPVTFTLPNGLKVFVVENHKMPIVTYSLQLAIYPTVQPNKAGLHDFVGELLTRGTTDRTKDEFDNAEDEIGAQIGVSGSSMYGVSLAKYQDSLLSLMSDALMHPAFEPKQLDKIVKQTKSGLIANENDPDNMLSNVSGVINFGKNHPYGTVMTLNTIQNISIRDCKNYYNTYFHPNVAYLAVVGDVTPEEAKKLVTRYFGSWKKADVPHADYPNVNIPQKRNIDFVNRAGAVQSVIALTYPVNLPIGSPEVIKAEAMNQILGGGSSGRLFQNLREKHGWTYGSYSSVSPDDIIGSVKVYAKCRNAVTDSSIAQMINEMDSIRNYPVSQKILDGVKNYMSGIFALRLESPQTIARYAINIDRYKMPKDYYRNYLKNVAKVTVADVQQMAQKFIRPNKANFIVVGNSSQVKHLKQFSPDGKINFYDAYGNPVQPKSETVVNGKKIGDVLNMYINAIGGEKAIKSLNYLRFNGNITIDGNVAWKIAELVASPNKLLRRIYPPSESGNSMDNSQLTAEQQRQLSQQRAAMRQMRLAHTQKVLVNGDKGYQKIGDKKTDLSKSDLRTYQAQADLQTILHPDKYGISFSLIKMGEVNGSPAYEVSKVSNNGKDKAIWYIDANSGLLVKAIKSTKQGGRLIFKTILYSKYKEVKDGNGFKMAFKMELTTGGSTKEINIISARANREIKDKKFR